MTSVIRNPLNWQAAQAIYIRQPLFASYGTFVERRPVRVDCSFGVNPLNGLYKTAEVTLPVAPFSRYPASGVHHSAELAAYVCQRWPTLKPEDICFGAGSQGTISSLSRILGGGMVNILGALPQFIPALLEFATAGAQVTTVGTTMSAPGIDIQALIEALTDETTAVYLDNPNNPTGQALPLTALNALAEACGKRGALLIVDEAYGDFITDDQSAFNLLQHNVICVRSFSKGCGLAGLRIGYIVIRDPVLRAIYQALGLHFSLSAAASKMAVTLLPSLDLPAMRQDIAALKKRVTDMISMHSQFTIAPTHPATPIFLLRWQDAKILPAESLYDALMDVGIQTEAGHFFGVDDKKTVRCRIPSPQDFEMFCALWQERFRDRT